MFRRTGKVADIKMDVSSHVETVVCLSKEDVDRGSSVRKSAAKNENNGMLSGKGKENREPEISQVKRKCGLEVGEGYNKPKSEDARLPQCTPEKEEAIMQALKHFGMI